MLRLDGHLPQDVRELFVNYSAREIVEVFERMDMLLTTEGIKDELTDEYVMRMDFTLYLLKRAVRALEPPKVPYQSMN